MREEVNPCPFCGEEEALALYDYPAGSFAVSCANCGFRGPATGYSESDAIAAWNALPRRLRWTGNKPTEPGWYCYRYPDGKWAIGYLRGNCITFPGGEYLYLDNAPGEFAGPIKTPKD